MQAISPDHVHIWIAKKVDLAPSGVSPRDEDLRLLDTDELTRANRFKFEHLREFFIFCHATIRRILASYANIPPASLEFEYAANGKPRLAGSSPLSFNTSHSGDLLVCAISLDRPLGIDIEQMRPLDDLQSIARHFFSPAEQQRLFELPPEQRHIAFFECWSRKEAIIKTTGEGVSRPLDSFEVAFGPEVTPRLVRIDMDSSPGWKLEAFEPEPDAPTPNYKAAVASSAPWTETDFRIVGKDLPDPA